MIAISRFFLKWNVNVQQVRILRGLGAIQPGVNRCKLISPQEFDVLYEDCTNSRWQSVVHIWRIALTPIFCSFIWTIFIFVIFFSKLSEILYSINFFFHFQFWNMFYMLFIVVCDWDFLCDFVFPLLTLYTEKSGSRKNIDYENWEKKLSSL